jgi:hypothetical protein
VVGDEMLSQEQRPPADGAFRLDVIALDFDHKDVPILTPARGGEYTEVAESRRKPAGSQNVADTRFDRPKRLPVPSTVTCGDRGEERLGRG